MENRIIFETRSNRHSSDPDNGCCEMNEAYEMDGSAIVAGYETTKMFEEIEASLDTVSVSVKSLVVRDEHLAVPF
jgi:hypothetical protein